MGGPRRLHDLPGCCGSGAEDEGCRPQQVVEGLVEDVLGRDEGGRREPWRRQCLLRLGCGPLRGRLLPHQGLHRLLHPACHRLRPLRGLHLDGDREADLEPGYAVRHRGPHGRAPPDVGLQPQPLLQLGRVRHDRRADGVLHLGPCQDGLLLAVHHPRGLPLRRAQHRPLRAGLREARRGGLRAAHPAQGARERGGDAHAPEVERLRDRRRDGQHHLGWHILHGHHERRRHRDPVRCQALNSRQFSRESLATQGSQLSASCAVWRRLQARQS
mmetsp:Transcript_35334/g.80254  ORF Transcript_35334/g.80254 Transcript_35334/m.80254 type:complete len:272 (+) Transcript_35334:1071-1886(+)